MKPIIGITSSTDNNGDHTLSARYCRRVLEAGGVPIILPTVGDASAAAGICDGIILSGGGDITPRLCGITEYDPIYLTDVSPTRDIYEFALVRAAYLNSTPTLGICRGLQVMNTALGGTLYFHIEGHMQKRSREQPSHRADITDGTLLKRLIGTESTEVNSFHHQAIKNIASTLTVSATAEDGTVEAAEASGKRFFLGVQWHPEHMDGRETQVLFAALCAACQK